jgi:hypothetical protein
MELLVIKLSEKSKSGYFTAMDGQKRLFQVKTKRECIARGVEYGRNLKKNILAFVDSQGREFYRKEILSKKLCHLKNLGSQF